MIKRFGVFTNDTKIVDAEDVASHHGLSLQSWRQFAARQNGYRIISAIANDAPVYAQVNYGRWVALCECGGAEYVSVHDPLFFCNACGNASVGGRLRPVVFPENIDEITSKLLEKPVADRNWKPEEVTNA